MDLVDKLKNKNIKVKEIPKWGTYLQKEWEKNFANHLSDKEKRKIYLFDNGGFGGYLWHLFSYKKKDCLEGEKAEEAFTMSQKINVISSSKIPNTPYSLKMLQCLTPTT